MEVWEPLATPGELEVTGERRSFVPEGRFTCEVPVNWNRDALSLGKTRASLQVSTLQIPKCTFFFKTLESFFQCDRKRTSHSLPL